MEKWRILKNDGADEKSATIKKIVIILFICAALTTVMMSLPIVAVINMYAWGSQTFDTFEKVSVILGALVVFIACFRIIYCQEGKHLISH
jgi:hypothetical protein